MADGYSKIETIEIFNFMPYEHAVAHFDENGILNLKGYNSVGKSAFNIAIAVCLMNMYQSKQGKFIRHDCKYFRIVVTFSDGISILRDKYDNGQSLYEMYDEGKLIFTTKQGDKLTKINDVPTPIKQYLDLVETEGSYLNFQERKSPLWLVETTGSENYKDLHSVLKIEEISRANAMLNSDINALNSDITSLESDIKNQELELQALGSLDRTFIGLLKQKEVEVENLGQQEGMILRISSGIEELLGIQDIPMVEAVDDCDRIAMLEGISEGVAEVIGVNIPPEVSIVSGVRQYEELEGVLGILESLAEVDKECVPNIGGLIEYEQQDALARIASCFKEVRDVEKEIIGLESEVSAVEEEKSEIIKEAESEGKMVVECTNCGTLMEVAV